MTQGNNENVFFPIEIHLKTGRSFFASRNFAADRERQNTFSNVNL